jgi:hypothetical protein
MQYVEHEDPHILVPRHISRNAFVSIQCFLLVAILAYQLEYYYVAVHMSFMYIFSLLHWRCVYRTSLIKTIDIILAVSFLIIFTVRDSARFYEFRPLWVVSVLITTGMFTANEVILYYQILYPRDMPEMVVHSNRALQWIMNYFSLTYTKPNTAAREWAYYRSVYTHMMFVHFIPSIVSAFCGITTSRYHAFDNPVLCKPI